MSIFIDTGIFIGYVNKDDEHHAAASGLVEEIMDKKYFDQSEDAFLELSFFFLHGRFAYRAFHLHSSAIVYIKDVLSTYTPQRAQRTQSSTLAIARSTIKTSNILL